MFGAVTVNRRDAEQSLNNLKYITRKLVETTGEHRVPDLDFYSLYEDLFNPATRYDELLSLLRDDHPTYYEWLEKQAREIGCEVELDKLNRTYTFRRRRAA